jgi:hypothetical protein
MIEENLFVPWIMTILIIIFKFAIAVFLGTISSKKIKEEKQFRLNFIFAMTIFCFTLGISRTFYFIFDFYLTKLNPALFYVEPNIWFWKLGNLFTSLGGIFVLYTIDKTVYQKKLRLIPEFILLIVAFAQFFYPVVDKASFDMVSAIGAVGSVISIIIPLTFIWLAIKSAGVVRRTSLILGIGIVVYGVVGQLLSEPVLQSVEAVLPNARILVWIIVPITKIVVLSFMAYAATQFRI